MRGSLRFDVRMGKGESAWSGVHDSNPSFVLIATRTQPNEQFGQLRRGTPRGSRSRTRRPPDERDSLAGWIRAKAGLDPPFLLIRRGAAFHTSASGSLLAGRDDIKGRRNGGLSAIRSSNVGITRRRPPVWPGVW